jgi:glutathione S-transferase
MLKLIGSQTSPYTRKVRVVLEEKKLPYDWQVEIPWKADSPVPQHNPLGKVPVLLRQDGSDLFDSRVIVEYLDGLGAGGDDGAPLLGRAFASRIAIKRWEALADGLSDAAAAIVVENRRVESERSPAWIARQEGKIEASLAALAKELGDKEWYEAGALSVADIATGCALGFLAFRLPHINWAGRYPQLEHLFEKLSKRPSFEVSVPRD